MHDAASFPVTEAYRGMRLDRFLQRMVPRMSRASVQAAIATRVTLASGAAAKASRRLVVGDVVAIGPSAAAAACDVLVPTLCDGGGWLVVDKPPGLACTPSSRRPGADVATVLGHAPAHRLDRFTSGCLLLARDPATARALARAFRDHAVEKDYLAVVEGVPDAPWFEVDAPLGVDAASRVTGKVAVTARGAPAATFFEVLARRGDRTLLRAQPRTGRRHQIRAHLAHVGHAIVGDVLYGGDERRFIRLQRGQPIDVPPGLQPGRHLLHAARLAFPDPGTGRRVEVHAPLPADFGLWPAPGAVS
ncbi:MAG: RluA family pseudouridine synthase [Planctomycetes bacterium]|nr:RluA family pseudouridine synthase [Planctomycetota bacterium]